ncbi:MAG: hypothetical protein ACPL25_02645 [Ignavibacteria bacterium]
MKRYFLIIILCLQNFSFAQVNDDFKILNQFVEESLQPVQDFLLSDSVKSIRINFIESNRLIDDLIRINFLKILNEDTNSFYSLDVLVKKKEVTYPEIVSYPLFGEEKIKREIRLEISYLISKNGFKVKSFDFNKTNIDTVQLSQILQMEPKLVSELPEIPFYRRLIEPAIISAVTGAIVYLFFITRSK